MGVGFVRCFYVCKPEPNEPTDPIDPVDPVLPIFVSCGDVEFDNYVYATVQIDHQCWLAENLRTERYANGDTILTDLDNGEWLNAYVESLGAQAIFNNDESNLAKYGRLYNWYAVNDTSGLCPNGWHVPSDAEFMTLEMELGMSESEANSTGWRGTDQGTQMKSSPSDDPSWDGTNTNGFSALAGGYRNSNNGSFNYEGYNGYFWSSSPDGTYAWGRILYSGYSEVNRFSSYRRAGFSVRCVRDV